MGVWHAHQIEHSLHAAIFPRHAMQRVKNDIRRGFRDPCGDLAVHVDTGDAVAPFFQRIGHAFAGH